MTTTSKTNTPELMSEEPKQPPAEPDFKPSGPGHRMMIDDNRSVDCYRGQDGDVMLVWTRADGKETFIRLSQEAAQCTWLILGEAIHRIAPGDKI